MHSEQEKTALKTKVVQAEEELCRFVCDLCNRSLQLNLDMSEGVMVMSFSRLKEHFSEQLTSLKAEHVRKLEHLRAAHALEHSSSEVARLSNAHRNQEVMNLPSNTARVCTGSPSQTKRGMFMFYNL